MLEEQEQDDRVDIYENKIRIALPVMCIDSESGKMDDSVRGAWDRFGGEVINVVRQL